MLIALTRAVPPSITKCQLTHLERTPIDVDKAIAEHEDYERTLADLGCAVRHADPAPDLPDSVFIEDTAIVLDEIAVITRPGAESRRAETAGVASALSSYRDIKRIEAPATIDGGDVLRIGKRIYAGLSSRSDAGGIAQLRDLTAPHGYEVVAVDVRGALHLKTAVTQASEGAVLINPEWVDASLFRDYDIIEIDASEPFAANVLRIHDTLVIPAAHPRTRALLEARGLATRSVPASELAKAEGGVTCSSLVFTQC